MKLPIISGKELLKILHRNGFDIVGRKGSHVRLKKRVSTKVLVTVVPMHDELDIGTLSGILRQCEISREEFESLRGGRKRN